MGAGMSRAMTAAELMAKLQADQNFRRLRAERSAERNAAAERLKSEEGPILNDLEEVGLSVASVWDLVNTRERYSKAVPILLFHLKRSYSDPIREGIARALAIPDAAGAWQTLLSEYQASPDGSRVKSGLAAALAAASSDAVIDDLAAAAKDPANGASRLLLLNGLRKSRSRVARETLAELKNDPALSQEIASWGAGYRK